MHSEFLLLDDTNEDDSNSDATDGHQASLDEDDLLIFVGFDIV